MSSLATLFGVNPIRRKVFDTTNKEICGIISSDKSGILEKKSILAPIYANYLKMYSGKYIGIHSNTKFIYSADLVSWSTVNLNGIVYERVLAGNGVILVIANPAWNNFSYSTDGGLTFTKTNQPATLPAYTYAVCVGSLFFIWDNAQNYYTSPSNNGLIWTNRGCWPSNVYMPDINNIVYSNGLYWISMPDDTTTPYIYTSPDGVTWTIRTQSATVNSKIFPTAGGIIQADGANIYFISASLFTRTLVFVLGTNEFCYGGLSSNGFTHLITSVSTSGANNSFVISSLNDGTSWKRRIALAGEMVNFSPSFTDTDKAIGFNNSSSLCYFDLKQEEIVYERSY